MRSEIQSKIEEILETAESAFDRAVEEIINDINQNLIKNSEWFESTSSYIKAADETYQLELEAAEEDRYIEPPVTCMEYISYVSENNGAKYLEKSWNEELLALYEMKIIYSYKQLEITLKKFLLALDPDFDIASLYRWEHIKVAMKSHNISIGSSSNYTFAIHLKDVNNALKHSVEIDSNVDKHNIKEFKNSETFTKDSLEAFYSRILPKINDFIRDLGKDILDKNA